MGNRTWMYCLVDGALESQIFDSNEIPDGWVDNPQLLSKDPDTTIPSEKEEKNRLEEYAYENYEVELDKRQSLDTLKAKVKALDAERDSK